MTPSRASTLAGVVLLALVYAIAGRFGLMLDPVSDFASLVWPPAGIALAGLTLYGLRFWPGIAIGSFFVNTTVGAPVPVAAGIAVGATLAGVIGAHALRRLPGFAPSLLRVVHVLALIALAAFGATTLSASIGVTSLFLGGVIDRGAYTATWSAWWLGDAMGVLLLAPVLLVFGAERPGRPSARRLAEMAALAAVLMGVSAFVFGRVHSQPASAIWQLYLLSPPLIWAALRFNQRGTAAGIFLVAVVAVWATATGRGPFSNGAVSEGLRSLQAFMATVAVTFLVFGAVTAERWVAWYELRKAKDAAEAASGAKSRFLAVTSHELRTPLTAIVGYADLMENEVVGSLNDTQRRQVRRIKAAAWHLVSVIESILSFTRSEAGREEIRPTHLDAVALGAEVVSLVEREATEKGLTVRIVAPVVPLPIHSDPGKLRQILLNLLGNAVKFSDAGEVVLEIEGTGDEYVFRVRDEGPGIPPADFERIFDPFTQVDQTTTRAKSGTGLGLAVSRTLARLLGGDIEVTSAVGQGSTFVLRLRGATPVPGANVVAGVPAVA